MSTLTASPDQAPARTYPSFSRPLWSRVLLTREMAVIGLFLLVYVFSSATVENFSSPLTLYYLFLDNIPVLLIALPMTAVIITGEIDLSVASVVGLSSCLVGLLHVDAGLSMPVAIVLALLAGLACGAFNGFLVAYVGLPSLAVTIGTLALYRGIAEGLLGTAAKTDFPQSWKDLATAQLGNSSPYPVVLVPIAVLALLIAWMLHFSSFGRGIFEIGLNDEAAHFTGVDVARTKLLLFMISGVVAALAGVYYTLRYGSARGDNATGMELQVVAAVLLGGVSIFGGRGALHGVIAGVLLIGVIRSAMTLEGLTVNVTNIVIGGLLVLSVLSTSLLAGISALRSRRASGSRSGPDATAAGKRSLSS
ncbi:ABC transporter permease [Nocardioides sp. GY 10127]|uniref:ABC transporter permease n=1 Tax=Nocardioides sp. GY 10127 TaxID=2569762 RepID=UPI0010A88FCA|nr:ABC transporter permease [Nocardioides sp. GY 10127]TIC82554.1 ABC transporter permease [Nocardioides sp. GY 10127]